MLRILASILVAAVLTGSAAAQEIVKKAEEADTLAGQGKYIEAIDALNQATGILWDETPLTFRRALWVAEPPNGFGAYDPRESDVYTAGEEMIAYTEPVGFGWRKTGDIWKTDLVADIVIKSKDGKTLFSQADFQKLQIGSRIQNREFMARFTYTLTGIPPGEYIIETTLRDTVSGKSGSFTLPFVIR